MSSNEQAIREQQLIKDSWNAALNKTIVLIKTQYQKGTPKHTFTYDILQEIEGLKKK